MVDNKMERTRAVQQMTVPPVWLARAGTWLRNMLGRFHARMTPGFGLVLERLFGIIDNKALYCAVVLEIPELLANGPRSAAEVATATGADPDAVDRLLRYLVSRDLFATTRDGQFVNNRATTILRTKQPYSFRDWVLFFGSDWNWQIWNQLPTRVGRGRSAAEATFGLAFFDYINRENPEAGDTFNGAMAAGSRIQAALFAKSIDLSPYTHVCDVGGGTGSTLVHLLRNRPGLQGTLFDLPALEKDAIPVLEAGGVADRATFVGGNFFECVPAGCDLYTLFAVVHDWDDHSCMRILGNIRNAMAPAGRIMIIEKPVLSGPAYDFAKASDMIMLVLSNVGRERTETEYEELFKTAGLRLRRRIALPSLFDVFELSAT